jgi:hypothetical protein
MNSQNNSPYKLAKEGIVLSNNLLTEWLIDIEERLRKIESSWSQCVTWEVSKAELAETKSENEE